MTCGRASVAETADDDRSVLQKYLAVTGKEIQLPQMLIDLDDDVEEDSIRTLLRGRDLIESAGSIAGIGGIVATAAHGRRHQYLRWQWRGLSRTPIVWTKASTIATTASGIAWCVRAARPSASIRTRSPAPASPRRRYFHFYWAYWFGWKWFYVQHPLIQQFVPQGTVKYWKHKGGKKRRRKVERYKTNNGSNPNAGFRSWTGFYN
ncbi:MAG: hypothetical protein R2911_32285 [Caldilineaceae bacterium]